MPLAIYTSAAWTANGGITVAAGATVEVRTYGSGQPLASIFSDREGNTEKDNPFTADAEGRFSFFVAGGSYRVKVTDGAAEHVLEYQAVGTAGERDTGSDAGQVPTNEDLPNSSAVGNEPDQLVKFEDDGEGGPRLPAASGSQLTGISVTGTKEVGEVFHLALRKSPSTSFPALRLTGEDQTITDAAWPLLVPELRDVLAYYRDGSTEADTFSGTVSGSVLTLDDAAAENELVEALAEDFLFSGAHKTVTLDDEDWQITDVDPVTREITVSGSPTDGEKTVEVHPYRVAGESGQARIGKADGVVLAGVGASGRMAGLATRDQMQQITGGIVASSSTGTMGLIDSSFASPAGLSGAISTDDSTTYSGSRVGFTDRDSFGVQFNSADSPNARTGTTTRDRSLGVELYIYGGQFNE